MPSIKRITIYGNYATWNGYIGEGITKSVFVYNCVSMPSKLNGRKVTRKYMRVAEKIKI